MCKDAYKAMHTKEISAHLLCAVCRHTGDPPPIVWSVNKLLEQLIHESIWCEAMSIKANNGFTNILVTSSVRDIKERMKREVSDNMQIKHENI